MFITSVMDFLWSFDSGVQWTAVQVTTDYRIGGIRLGSSLHPNASVKYSLVQQQFCAGVKTKAGNEGKMRSMAMRAERTKVDSSKVPLTPPPSSAMHCNA